MKHYQTLTLVITIPIFAFFFILWHLRLEIILNNHSRDIGSMRAGLDRLYSEIKRTEAARREVERHIINTYVGGEGGTARSVLADERGVAAGGDVSGEQTTGDI